MGCPFICYVGNAFDFRGQAESEESFSRYITGLVAAGHVDGHPLLHSQPLVLLT